MNDLPIPAGISDSPAFTGTIVYAQLSPFRSRELLGTVDAGHTIAELVGEASALVWLDGRAVARERWATVQPGPGQRLHIRIVPQGDDKGILRAVLAITIAIAAPYAAAATLGVEVGALAATTGGLGLAAGYGVAGTLALNALIPPPSQNLPVFNAGDPASIPNITGTSNQAQPFGLVPKVYGRHKTFPPVAAQPFTEIQGTDQFLRQVFCFGHGPLRLENIQIGDTAIDQFQDVQYEIRRGYQADKLKYVDHIILLSTEGYPATAAFGDVYSLGFASQTPDGQNFGNTNTKTTSLGDSIVFNGQAAPSSSAAWDLNGNKPLTLYASDVATTPQSVTYDDDADQAVRGVSLTAAGSVSLDFVAASGLIEFEDDGEKRKLTVGFLIEASPSGAGSYSKVTDTSASGSIRLVDQIYTGFGSDTGDPGPFVSWIFPGNYVPPSDYDPELWDKVDASFALVGRSTDTQRGSVTFPLAAGDWDIRITRVISGSIDEEASQNRDGINEPLWGNIGLGEAQGQKVFDSVVLTALRTIQSVSPIEQQTDGLALLAMRIRATDQLQGAIDRASAVVTSILPTWDGSAWVENPTSNPAYCYRDVFVGAANPRPVPAARMDDAALVAWAAECDNQGWEFNAPIRSKSTVFDIARQVAALGRGAFGMRDGLFSVVLDLPQSVPRQLFTARNSWGFEATVTYQDQPHGLRAKFVNPDADWQEDELLVYADGYDETTATEFETFKLFGVTSQDLAFKHARLAMAEAVLRPIGYVLHADIEHIACERGDLVHIQHDAILAGLGTSRIVGVAGATVTLEDAFTIEGGKSYGLRIRRDDNTHLVEQVTSGAGTHTEITLASAPGGVQAGDLVAFGELGKETVEAILKSIEPLDDLSARLAFAPHAPALYDALNEPIPPFDPGITLPPEPQSAPPPAPTIDSVRSDESVARRNTGQTLEYALAVSFSVPSGTPAAEYVQVQIKEDFAPVWTTRSAEVALGQVEFLGVRPLQIYDIRARSISQQGVASAWVSASHQVVGQTQLAPAIAGLSTEPKLGAVQVRWDALPASVFAVEVYASLDTTFGNATLIERAVGVSLVTHTIGDGTPYYYWARSFLAGSAGGPLAGSVPGTPITTSQYIADAVAGLLDETSLDDALNTRIDLIDAPDTVAGSVSARVDDARADAQAARDALDDALHVDLGVVRNSIFESALGEELTFDVQDPGGPMSPIGWRGGNGQTGYIAALDASQAAYGALAQDASEWFVAKCFRIKQPVTSFDGSVQAGVASGQASVMARFYDDDGVYLDGAETAPITTDGNINYSFTPPTGAEYIELLLIAADSGAYAATIPPWFDLI